MKKYLTTFIIAAPIALLISAQISPAFWHGIATAVVVITNSGIGGSLSNTLGTDSVVNVKNYGAVGNGQWYPFGAMATGSSTLTTKQPIATATVSGTTVTITLTGNVPGYSSGGPPTYPTWSVGSNITIAGVSGGTGFNGTFPITATPSIKTFQYSTTATGSGTGGTATSIDAPFTSGDVGKLICVQAVSASSFAIVGRGQICGTIATFVDSQDVTLSFSNASGAIAGGVSFAYATNDTAALQAAFNALPGGGLIFFPVGRYGTNAMLNVPITGSINVLGAAGGGADMTYNGTATAGTYPTTAILALTQSMAPSDAALHFGNDSISVGYVGTWNFSDRQFAIRDIAVIGGVGWARDGGGGHGIWMQGPQATMIEHVNVGNFKQSCIYHQATWGDAVFLANNIQGCGQVGIYATGQGILYSGNQIHTNGTYGIVTVDDNIIIGNTIEANGTAAVAPGGGNLITGNHTEGNNVVSMTNATSISLASTRIENNVGPVNHVFLAFGSATATFTGVASGNTLTASAVTGTIARGAIISGTGSFLDTQIVSQTSGTPGGAGVYVVNIGLNAGPTLTLTATMKALPAPTAVPPHVKVLVTDATACTNGTVYTAGGLITCVVNSDGTNWIETGAGGY